MAHVRTGNVARDVESRHNRDIGAAAATTDGLDALGRLSAVKGSDSGSLEPDTGAAFGLGAIERRQATPEELARLDEPEPVKETAETRAGGMKIRTLGWIKLVEGQTYENPFRERLTWDVLLVVRPAA